ncbi:MAG: 50S ribosomal protein L9 [Candidatus Eisenbacteria bacterium]|nr:50S ribosomal protein L9 [Candidatus Eisenbacteria bacterium]
MKVILVEDVARLGSRGDVVTVKDGYARNYLIPSAKALPATEGALRQLQSKVKLDEVRLKKDRRRAEEIAERMSGVSCTIRVQADEGDKLYGSVGPRDIAQALDEQGYETDPGSIVLDEHIKMLGVYPVRIRLFSDVEAEVKVWVIRE